MCQGQLRRHALNAFLILFRYFSRSLLLIKDGIPLFDKMQ